MSQAQAGLTRPSSEIPRKANKLNEREIGVICYNKKMKSRIGLILVVLYILFVGYLWFAELSCTGWGCGYSLILAIMPWPLVLEGTAQFSIPLFIILFLLNATILYFIGLGLSKIFRQDRGVL